MNKGFLIFSVLLGLCCSNAMAEKLYKIVDDQGNITFSQFPPREKAENTVVEDVNVRGGGAMEAVRYVGSSAYCGDIRLPTDRAGSSARSSEYRAEYLNESVNDWRESLRELEARAQQRSRDKLNRGGSNASISEASERNGRYQEGMNSDIERMRELRCAIHWSEKEGQSSAEVLSEGQSENARLHKVHVDLEEKMLSTCGHEPLLDPTDPGNAKARRQWKACTKSYRKDLDAVESELRNR